MRGLKAEDIETACGNGWWSALPFHDKQAGRLLHSSEWTVRSPILTWRCSWRRASCFDSVSAAAVQEKRAGWRAAKMEASVSKAIKFWGDFEIATREKGGLASTPSWDGCAWIEDDIRSKHSKTCGGREPRQTEAVGRLWRKRSQAGPIWKRGFPSAKTAIAV